MNLAALIFTAITAAAALWTVRLSYRAIRLARDASKSAEDSAGAARDTANEVKLGRERDRLISDRHRYHDLLELSIELRALQGVVASSKDARWSAKTVLLASKLAGSEETFPATASIIWETSVPQARVMDSVLELGDALRAIEARIYVHDFG